MDLQWTVLEGRKLYVDGFSRVQIYGRCLGTSLTRANKFFSVASNWCLHLLGRSYSSNRSCQSVYDSYWTYFGRLGCGFAQYGCTSLSIRMRPSKDPRFDRRNSTTDDWCWIHCFDLDWLRFSPCWRSYFIPVEISSCFPGSPLSCKHFSFHLKHS